MRRTAPKAIGFVITFVLAMAVHSGSASAVQLPIAAPPPPGEDAGSPAPVEVYFAPPPSDDPSISRTYSCAAQVNNPHNSTHVRGTVNTVVRVVCNARMSYISVRAAVYYNHGFAKQSPSKTVYNASVASTNVAVPCRPGRYRGYISTYIQAPAGFSPSSARPSGFGNVVNLSC